VDAWLIANVGQRDLHLDGRPLEAKRLRIEGERVEREYGTLRERISAPMLFAALDHLRSMPEKAQVRVLLVATDQADPRFREGDTVNCAAVLKRVIADRGMASKVLVRTAGDQPNLYDRMLEYYRSRALQRLEPPGERYYLLLAGGTPAANTALLLAGVWRFGEKAHALSVGEDTGRVRPMDIGRRIVASYRRDRVNELLERRDFAGATALLDAGSSARLVADAAAKRLNLDFEPSRNLLGETLSEIGGSAPAEIDALYAEAQRLTDDDRAAVMREVYWNAIVKWRREEYADFLGRVWRLMEASLQEAVGRVCGLNLADEHGTRADFERWVRERPALVALIEKELGEPLRRVKQSSWLLGVVLGWIVAQNPPDLPDALRNCHNAVQTLDRLRSLRNDCVLAHGFKALSRDAILARLENPEEGFLLNSLVSLLAVWGVTPGNDPYEQFAIAVKGLL